ncbi:MAG: hypothetical protein JO329_20745 [Planctomycetaceae bacterium]|nr:hypothetical protein [Planctomycetaceae bacterium]MBV8555718.1 hypothetical protein [Planctomycetaceae bacterium]
MASAPTVSPCRSFDEHGRALPLAEEEVRRRAEQAIRTLEALWDLGDEAEQRATLEALVTALDEDRPPELRRFPGCA